MNNVEDLEPAERNPRAIRNTVLILSLIILVGGFLVAQAYNKYQREQTESYLEGYTARSSAITKNYQFKSAGGEIKTLGELEGCVSLFCSIAPSQPKENQRTLAILKRAAEAFPEEERLRFICLSLEGDKPEALKTLASYTKELAIEDSRWWFVTAEEESMLALVKDRLRIGQAQEHDSQQAAIYGKYDVPGKIRLVDQGRNLRGNYEDYDFDIYYEEQSSKRQQLQEDPSLGEIKGDRSQFSDKQKFFMMVFPELKELRPIDWYLEAPEIEFKMMLKQVRYALDHSEEPKKPNYNMALIVFITFILFVLIVGKRYRNSLNSKS